MTRTTTAALAAVIALSAILGSGQPARASTMIEDGRDIYWARIHYAEHPKREFNSLSDYKQDAVRKYMQRDYSTTKASDPTCKPVTKPCPTSMPEGPVEGMDSLDPDGTADFCYTRSTARLLYNRLGWHLWTWRHYVSACIRDGLYASANSWSVGETHAVLWTYERISGSLTSPIAGQSQITAFEQGRFKLCIGFISKDFGCSEERQPWSQQEHNSSPPTWSYWTGGS